MRQDLVAIGASAGGVEALSRFAAALPAGLPAVVLVVLHIPAAAVSALPHILARAGRLPVRHAEDGEHLRPGQILVAPPDHHLVVHPGVVRLVRGPRENGHRPAIDPLFRSAAHAYGPRVLGVVASGALDDGSAGLAVIRAKGGVTAVQDPAEAMFDGMPRNAMAYVEPDHVLPVRELARLVARLASPALAPQAEWDPEPMSEVPRPSSDRPSAFSCPDCRGVLFDEAEGGLHRYRCRVGHAWSPDALLAQQAVELENALWTALRSLEEKVNLARRLAASAQERGDRLTAARYRDQAEDGAQQARLLRELLVAGDGHAVSETLRERQSDEQ